MDPSRRGHISLLVLSVAILTAAHFSVSSSTHQQHVIHVVLRGLYLLPIIAGAVWFGLRGGVTSAVSIGVVYAGHILLSWRDQPMENVNQFAMVAVYLLVGTISGKLVDMQEREKDRRLKVEHESQRSAVIQGIASLSNALRAREENAMLHSEQVAVLAVEIGKHMRLPDEKLELLRLAALIHDVGKIGIRDDVLLNPNRLTSEEREAVERHPTLAAEILKPILATDEIVEIVLDHHECLDGSGYPRGLTGEQIPLEARILSVADVYSALTEERTYKSPMSAKEAMDIIESMAGTKLDGEIVQNLREIIDEGKVCV